MARTMVCPKCGGVLCPKDDRIGTIYTCEPCGVQVTDYKFKVRARCMEIVLEVLDEIEGVVASLSKSLRVEIFAFYLWKSRARGDCRYDSDIDIWLEVSINDAHRVDELNRRLVENPLPWHEHKGRRVVWDYRFGDGHPEAPYYSHHSLKLLRARLLSS